MLATTAQRMRGLNFLSDDQLWLGRRRGHCAPPHQGYRGREALARWESERESATRRSRNKEINVERQRRREESMREMVAEQACCSSRRSPLYLPIVDMFSPSCRASLVVHWVVPWDCEGFRSNSHRILSWARAQARALPCGHEVLATCVVGVRGRERTLRDILGTSRRRLHLASMRDPRRAAARCISLGGGQWRRVWASASRAA